MPFLNIFRRDIDVIDKLEKEIGKQIFKSYDEVNLDVLEEFIHIRFVVKEYTPATNWAKSRKLYKFRYCT